MSGGGVPLWTCACACVCVCVCVCLCLPVCVVCSTQPFSYMYHSTLMYACFFTFLLQELPQPKEDGESSFFETLQTSVSSLLDKMTI